MYNANRSLCRCFGQLEVNNVDDNTLENVDQTLKVHQFVFPPGAYDFHRSFTKLQEGTAERHLQFMIVFGVFKFVVEGQCEVDAESFSVRRLGDKSGKDLRSYTIPDLTNNHFIIITSF